MTFRKINRVIHRDFGYFFAGMILIYAVSGIALNHKNDWNPNYIIEISKSAMPLPPGFELKSTEVLNYLLDRTGQTASYKKHYYPSEGGIKVFLQGGSLLTYNPETEVVLLEQLKKRPLFHAINFLHYNPGNAWKWFSDIFCVCLILVTISGTIILKGKNGIKGRGWLLILAGIIIPVVFFFIY